MPTKKPTLEKQHQRYLDRADRIEWYLREYGRPPTREELIALREIKRYK